jgi:hypothetical protein
MVPAAVAALLLSMAPTASAEVDPFPTVASGAELPGTRIWSQPGVTQATYEATPEYLAWIAAGCPAGSGIAAGVDMNFTESHADDRYFNYCAKTWQAPVVAPAPVVAVQEVITNRFGGYAVVHPGDGHVCGVVVSASSDPFNNGGYMSNEYMGCPAGSRFVFQTTPSESGNVAGWHGSNVIWDGAKFTITYPNSWIQIANGIATDNNGRSWDTGTGRVIAIGNVPPPVVSDSSTPRVDTQTVVSGTTTPVVTAPVESTTVVAPVPTLFSEPITTSVLDSSTAVSPTPADDLDSLPEVAAEEEISNSVIGTIVGVKTRIAVSTAWASTNMRVVASKKGFKKKYTYRFTTNSEGDYIFKSGVNLKGYTVILYKGSEELDRDYIS